MFSEFLCSISNSNRSKKKNKCTQKINKIKTPVNFFICWMWHRKIKNTSWICNILRLTCNTWKRIVNFKCAACGMEKLKKHVEYSIFCVLHVISEKGFNTTLFPGGLPPQYWASSNRVNFGDRTRTGALRLIWSNPFGPRISRTITHGNVRHDVSWDIHIGVYGTIINIFI